MPPTDHDTGLKCVHVKSTDYPLNEFHNYLKEQESEVGMIVQCDKLSKLTTDMPDAGKIMLTIIQKKQQLIYTKQALSNLYALCRK